MFCLVAINIKFRLYLFDNLHLATTKSLWSLKFKVKIKVKLLSKISHFLFKFSWNITFLEHLSICSKNKINKQLHYKLNFPCTPNIHTRHKIVKVHLPNKTLNNKSNHNFQPSNIPPLGILIRLKNLSKSVKKNKIKRKILKIIIDMKRRDDEALT